MPGPDAERLRQKDGHNSDHQMIADQKHQGIPRHGHSRKLDRSCFVHQWFESQAARNPNSPAVACGSASLTYAQLNERANSLAWRLRSLGVKSNTPVAICLDRSIELIVAIYGVLKAGGAYVPLDPAYPASRLAYMIESVYAPVAICAARQRPLLIPHVPHVIDSITLTGGIGQTENPRVVSSPEDLFYIIFTSGSTGRPKGAGVYNKGFANLLDWFTADFGINETDRSLLVSSFSFDLTQKNYFATLAQGGTLHLALPGPYDPDVLTSEIESRGITLLNCTPSAAYPLLEPGTEERFARLRTLRCLVLGGEPISTQRLRAWTRSRHFNAEIVNTYGPTECTDICAFHRLTERELSDGLAVPLGRPVDNTCVTVLDQNFMECPPGDIGEIWVAGAGVGAGYLTDAELTQDKFLPNPVPDLLPGAQIYRTGDMGRWRADGTLEFAGRVDFQVKIRGFRVELSEIEAILEQHNGVKEAVVVARRSSAGVPDSLGAFFVLKGEEIAPNELREFVRQRLPEHMVPAVFYQMENFPLSANGKIDRRALHEMAVEAPAEPAALPAWDLESRVTQVWSEVLRIPVVSPDANFFDVGGNSLQLVEVHERLSKFLAAEQVSVTRLFQHPTIASFCASLSGTAAANSRLFPSEASGQGCRMSVSVDERGRKQRMAFSRPARSMSPAGLSVGTDPAHTGEAE
jgi:amino acid adenylation domain-containing protein